MAPVEHVKVGVENGEVSRVERRWRCPEVWNLDGDQGRCCNGAGLSGVGRAGGGKAGRQVASRPIQAGRCRRAVFLDVSGDVFILSIVKF